MFRVLLGLLVVLVGVAGFVIVAALSVVPEGASPALSLVCGVVTGVGIGTVFGLYRE